MAATKNQPPQDTLNWADSDDAAVADAGPNVQSAGRHGAVPVMIALLRDNNADDLKELKKIALWPNVVALYKIRFLPVKITTESMTGKALVKRFGATIAPGIVWMDHYGNALLFQPMPDVPEQLTNVILTWETTLKTVERYFKEHVDKGDSYALHGKLRTAWQEYAIVAPFKGPQPDKAREGQKKIKESWMKLVAAAVALDPKSPVKAAMIKGLHTETDRLDVAAEIDAALKHGPEVAAGDAAPALAASASETPAAAKSEASKAPEKSLADLARSTRNIEASAETVETGSFDLSVLAEVAPTRA